MTRHRFILSSTLGILCFGFASSAYATDVAIQAQVFGGYYQTLSPDNLGSFEVTRAQLDSYFDLTSNAHARVMLETFRSASEQSLFGLDGNSMATRLKLGLVEGRGELASVNWMLRAGLIPDTWIDTLETLYPLRGLSPLMSESMQLVDTGDLGAELKLALLDELLELRVSATNGEGRRQVELNEGKNLSAVLAVNTELTETSKLKGLLFYRDGSSTAANIANHRLGSAVQLSHHRFGLGIEAMQTQGLNGRGSIEALGLGGYAYGDLIPTWLGLAASFSQLTSDDSDTALDLSTAVYSDFGAHPQPGKSLRVYAGYRRNQRASLSGNLESTTEDSVFIQFSIQGGSNL